MTTIVEFKDGKVSTFDDAQPSCYCDELTIEDDNAGIIEDGIMIADVKRVIFENENKSE